VRRCTVVGLTMLRTDGQQRGRKAASSRGSRRVLLNLAAQLFNAWRRSASPLPCRHRADLAFRWHVNRCKIRRNRKVLAGLSHRGLLCRANGAMSQYATRSSSGGDLERAVAHTEFC
jgi:hypothetical protein